MWINLILLTIYVFNGRTGSIGEFRYALLFRTCKGVERKNVILRE